MRALRAFTVIAVVGVLGLTAPSADAALAKARGGSGFSGTLSSNKAIRKQQLICDPDSPTGGSTSTAYDPSVVSLSGLAFGPGYAGSGQVEVAQGGETFLTDLQTWLVRPFGTQTGYVQVSYMEPAGPIGIAPAALPDAHGQIAPPKGYLLADRGGPAAVDTHALLFDYLPTVPDGTVAEYRVYADVGTHGNAADYLAGVDDAGSPFRVAAADIEAVTVRGSLNVVPLPPAVLAGGVVMGGMVIVRRLRRGRVA